MNAKTPLWPVEHFKLDSTYMLRWCILGVSGGGGEWGESKRCFKTCVPQVKTIS